MGWIKHLYGFPASAQRLSTSTLPDFETFWEEGHARLPEPSVYESLLEPFRKDPEANPLSTPSGKIEITSQRIASFGYDDCPGHPVWLEPAEWWGSERAKTYPLHLVSNQPMTRLHSQYDNGSVSRASKIAQREPVTLHPDDARARGIEAGDVVRIFNDRGACLAGARISDEVLSGTIQLATGAWYDPLDPTMDRSLDRHGNPNVLTIDKGTSQLSQAPVAHTALVEVERYRGEPPEVGAFVPPPIMQSPD